MMKLMITNFNCFYLCADWKTLEPITQISQQKLKHKY